MRRYIIFVFAVFLPKVMTVTPVTTVTVFALNSKIMDVTQELLHIMNSMENDENLERSKRSQKALFDKLDYVTDQLRDIPSQLNDLGDLRYIMRILNNLPSTIQKELEENNIRLATTYLEIYFQKMEKYVSYSRGYENATLIEFAKNVVSTNSDSVPFLTELLNKIVTGREFLDLLHQQMKTETDYFCTKRQSAAQGFHNLMNEILFINLKSYVVEQVAYMFKKLFLKGGYKTEIEDSMIDFKRRNSNLIKTITPYILNASSVLWRCDSQGHKEGDTFIQVTNFLHGYVINKANLDPKGSCGSECGVYSHTKTQQCNNNKWCKKQPPCDKIISCNYVDSSMTVCPKVSQRYRHFKSNGVFQKNGNRRYSYIKFGNGRTYGKKSACHSTNFLETYNYWVFQRCSYCFCLCNEGPSQYSDRYINIRLATSNIQENKVVTGLRFVKKNRIIHLQVQEGALLSHGQIDHASLRWVPVANYKTIDNPRGNYITLAWEERAFDLTDIKLNTESVITGVRFKKVDSRIYIEAQVTPFNFTTGQLQPNQTYFKNGPDFKYRKFAREMKLHQPDIPTLIRSTDFTTGKYVKLTHTDFEKDAGQTTVPFFDAQEVTSAIPVPLSGIGIFHKGREGSGGFLAPRIFTYDFSLHLEAFQNNADKER